MLNITKLLSTIVKKNGYKKYSWNREYQQSYHKALGKVGEKSVINNMLKVQDGKNFIYSPELREFKSFGELVGNELPNSPFRAGEDPDDDEEEAGGHVEDPAVQSWFKK